MSMETCNPFKAPISRISSARGFTLIELMIVVSIIAIILTISIPVFSNYSIRAKIAEGMSIANSAKTAVSATCSSDLGLLAISNSLIGWDFAENLDSVTYVASILASGPCTTPIISITTKNTGVSPDPVLTLTGALSPTSGQIEWRCSSTNTAFNLLPATCRSSS